jgi:diadenosine tetraphosphate (Ap4A) HIT family hydrolase
VSLALDPRLAADTVPVAELALCSVRLMDDARFGWLVLVPRQAALVEVTDLPADARALMWQEVELAGEALRAVFPCDKLNIGALGNIVRQLHVHVVARREGDAAWPGPVWGRGPAAPYTAAERQARVAELAAVLIGLPADPDDRQ